VGILDQGKTLSVSIRGITPAVPETSRAADRDPSWEARVAGLIPAINWSSALPARAATTGWALRQVAKRMIDLVVAAAALVLLAPVFGVIAFLIKLDGGSVFYPWRVVGQQGRLFTGYKFRTMVPNADDLKDTLQHLNEMSGPVFKIRDDPRVTRLGRFLRRHSVDEFPQLWSVLKGDMTLVGPRPPSPREFVEFEPWQRLKMAVRPGLTCLWQVSGRSNIREVDDWVALDLKYIQEWSLVMDFRILFRTILVVLLGSGGY
jgi:lipopolysaccharide/colanic/teichoic acid biosynthesis glycosyltransferase